MRLPFIGARIKERAFRRFLCSTYGHSAAEVRREAEEDNLFLCRELTYSGLEEVFLAGWGAAEKAIKRAK